MPSTTTIIVVNIRWNNSTEFTYATYLTPEEAEETFADVQSGNYSVYDQVTAHWLQHDIVTAIQAFYPEANFGSISIDRRVVDNNEE